MKLQIKISKILCFVTLSICALSFIFSLGLTTDLYSLYKMEIDGSEILDIIQGFNSTLVILSLVSIVASACLFITRTNSRRRYYISNYICVGIIAVLFIAIAVYSVINLNYYRTYFLENTDFEMWQFYVENIYHQEKYTQSTFWFDINIFIAILYIIASFLLVGNLIWKITLMKFEDKLLKSGGEHYGK